MARRSVDFAVRVSIFYYSAPHGLACDVGRRWGRDFTTESTEDTERHGGWLEMPVAVFAGIRDFTTEHTKNTERHGGGRREECCRFCRKSRFSAEAVAVFAGIVHMIMLPQFRRGRMSQGTGGSVSRIGGRRDGQERTKAVGYGQYFQARC